jgi:uncharacterized metal-binding protein
MPGRRVVVTPLPVLYACQGCSELGQAAREAGAALDRAGVVELVWLGAAQDLKPTQRYPIFALDACGEACARRWLERRGVAVDRSYVLPESPR